MKIDIKNRRHCNRIVDAFTVVVIVWALAWAHYG